MWPRVCRWTSVMLFFVAKILLICLCEMKFFVGLNSVSSNQCVLLTVIWDTWRHSLTKSSKRFQRLTPDVDHEHEVCVLPYFLMVVNRNGSLVMLKSQVLFGTFHQFELLPHRVSFYTLVSKNPDDSHIDAKGYLYIGEWRTGSVKVLIYQETLIPMTHMSQR